MQLRLLKVLQQAGPMLFNQGERADTLQHLKGGASWATLVVTSPQHGHAIAAAINYVLRVTRVAHHPKKKSARERALEALLRECLFELEEGGNAPVLTRRIRDLVTSPNGRGVRGAPPPTARAPG